jgi:eukaryotic-like serine/threonine-protein kinase
MTLTPGTRLGPYEIEAPLGAGGMGEVYRAKDTKLRREVAIKVIRPDLLADSSIRRRFLHEARTAASINHPNIATIYAVDEALGVPFIAMELVDGRTVRSLIPEGVLTITKALELAIQIAEGLAEAHRAGVVHRDLKPENIIVTAGRRVKILDFGIAKLGGVRGESLPNNEVETRTATAHDTIVGTASYMSPEQVRGERVDARSDIFSFGTTLYEMVTGEKPFGGETRMDAMAAILTEAAPPLSRSNPGAPLELDLAVAKCLEKNPAKRFQRADELLTELQRIRDRVLDDGTAVSAEAGAPRKKLVVLPFENLGPAEEEYFASGMTEEITSRLAVVSGLGVISRTTAMQYEKGRKSIRQIGDELGVDFVLEGTVRWARSSAGPNRVRITPQLIRVSDDTHVWADRYDRVMDDVFQVQSEIAEHVTEQLGVVLLASELKEVRDRPTRNFDAYQAYLRGLYYERPRGFLEERDRLAVRLLQEAVDLDPGFALAHAELAVTHAALYHYGFDHSAERLALAARAVEQAFRLAPESPRVRLALGYYHYWCRRDYDRAFAELTVALRGMPGNSDVLAAMGFVRRRQGQWQAALDHFKKACELNPMDTHFAIQLGDTFSILERYEEAGAQFDKSIRYLPDQVAAYVAKATMFWRASGDLASARSVLEAMPETARNSSFGFVHWFWQEVFEGRYRDALDRVSHMSEDVVTPGTGKLLSAQVHRLLGDREPAQAAFEAARLAIEAGSWSDPENYWLHGALALVYAGLGREDDAIREGRQATELCPASKDPLDSGSFVKNLALVHTMIGQLDAALDLVEDLLASDLKTGSVENLSLFPSTFSLPMLRIDPRWQPLWEHPRFIRLSDAGRLKSLPE